MCDLCTSTRSRPRPSFASPASGEFGAARPERGAPVVLGHGTHAYEVCCDWGELPQGVTFGDAPAVCVDSSDTVYVLTRGNHPVMVFHRDGRFLRSFGHDIGFSRPHGAAIGPDDMLYITDDGDHTVRKCRPDGTVVLTIGMPGKPSPALGGEPFNRCTHTALSPAGDIYVSDGYSNARVHKFDPNGKLLFSWGESGTGPGQFNTVHNICCDDAGWVYVADRENHRVQVFDGTGRYQGQWNNLSRPCGLFIQRGRDPLCVIGELGPTNVATTMRHARNLGPRVTLTDTQGTILAHLGTEPLGEDAGQFIAPHGIAMDSRGDIYVAEVSNTYWPLLFGTTPTHELRCLQKLRRVDRSGKDNARPSDAS